MRPRDSNVLLSRPYFSLLQNRAMTVPASDKCWVDGKTLLCTVSGIQQALTRPLPFHPEKFLACRDGAGAPREIACWHPVASPHL